MEQEYFRVTQSIEVSGVTVPYTISPKTDYNVELGQRSLERSKKKILLCAQLHNGVIVKGLTYLSNHI